MLDLRGVLATLEVPFATDSRDVAGLQDAEDGGGLTIDLVFELTVTILVVIFGGAFLAFMAESDKGRFCAGSGPILKND